MKRAFLFGLATQLLIISAIFLLFDDYMIPKARSPIIGVFALCFGVVSGYFAWRATPYPSWPAKIGLWIAGFLAPHVILIPF